MYPVLPVNRRLQFTPYRTPKRARFMKTPRTPAAALRPLNKRQTKAPSAKGTVKQQLASLRRAVKHLAPELKLTDLLLTQNNVTSSGTIQHVSNIAQGTDSNQRVGNSINVRNIALHVTFTSGSEASAATTFRYALVQDKQQISDTAPTISDVFNSTDPKITMPAQGSRERFNILWLTKPFTVNDLTNGTRPFTREWNWSGSITIDYNGSAQTDQQKNALYFVILSDSGASTADFTGTLRLQYTDV